MTTPSFATDTTPTFSVPFEWHDSLDVTLEFLQDPAFAIRFALDHVDPGMVRDFMEDWQEDHGSVRQGGVISGVVPSRHDQAAFGVI